MPEGIPPPTDGTKVFSMELSLGTIHDVGRTQYGDRLQLEVTGGTAAGDRIQATAPAGGLEYELRLSNGAMEVEEVHVLKTSDNTRILMRNCGVAPAGQTTVRIVADFEAPNSSSYAWLNTTKLVGTRVVDTVGGKITLDIYDVTAVPVGAPSIQLTDPAGVRNTSWDCLTGSGTRGASVFTETVGLGGTIVITSGKRGTRNIIPITGGTTTGNVAGTILSGGADYQLSATSTMDQRYTVTTHDHETIIVRNCGSTGGPIPTFEARADGPYGFLNENKYLSSAPGMASGGISLTIYERVP